MAIHYPSGVGPESILTANLANLSVTEPKLATGAVAPGKMAENLAIPTKPAEGALTQQGNQCNVRKVVARINGNGVITAWEYAGVAGGNILAASVSKVSTGETVPSGWTAKVTAGKTVFNFTVPPAAGEEFFLITVW